MHLNTIFQYLHLYFRYATKEVFEFTKYARIHSICSKPRSKMKSQTIIHQDMAEQGWTGIKGWEVGKQAELEISTSCKIQLVF